MPLTYSLCVPAWLVVWLCRARWAPYSVWTSLLTGGGANQKTAMFAMQKVMRAAPSALLNVGVLAPVAEAFGLQVRTVRMKTEADSRD